MSGLCMLYVFSMYVCIFYKNCIQSSFFPPYSFLFLVMGDQSLTMLVLVLLLAELHKNMILIQTSLWSHKNRKEARVGSTVMMVLLAFSKVLIYSDGHSLER